MSVSKSDSGSKADQTRKPKSLPRPKVRLNKTNVDGIQPEAEEYMVWDLDLDGFGIRISPKGRVTYIVARRDRMGKFHRVKIGVHGQPWTSDKARAEAVALLKRLDRWWDPSAEKMASRKAAEAQLYTIKDAIEIFMREHGESRLKESSRKEYSRNFDKHVIPAFGDVAVVDLSRQHITDLLAKIGKKSPIAANRTRAQLSKLCNWLEARGDRPANSNPVKHAPKMREKPRERMLSREEFKALSDAMERLEAEGKVPSGYANCLRFIAWTGCRSGEAWGLQWQQLNDDLSVCRLGESKTGAKSIYLGSPVRALLEAIGRQKKGAVFQHNGAPINKGGLDYYWCRIRTESELPGLRIHDLRHAMASVAAEMGLSLQQTGALLGHTRIETTRRYSHLFEHHLVDKADVLAEEIAARMTGQSTPPKRRA